MIQTTFFIRGKKRYEFSNHLGNVMTTLTDRWVADAVSGQDYDPFGMVRPNRSVSEDGYRFGFNGKEKDTEFGEVVYDYGFRIYDGRIARFLSVDPLSKNYPWYTPYQFSGNMPIAAIDLDGLESFIMIHYRVGEQRMAKLTMVDADRTKLNVTHAYEDGSIEILTRSNTDESNSTNPFRDARLLELVDKNSAIEENGRISYNREKLIGYSILDKGSDEKIAKANWDEDEYGYISSPTNEIDVILEPKYTEPPIKSFVYWRSDKSKGRTEEYERRYYNQLQGNRGNKLRFVIFAHSQNFVDRIKKFVKNTPNEDVPIKVETVPATQKEGVKIEYINEKAKIDTSADAINDNRPR